MVHGFCDFNLLPKRNVQDVRTLCAAACKVGYKCVAINTIVEESVFESRKKQKRKGGGQPPGGGGEPADQDIIPPPLQIDQIKQEFAGRLEILQRLTVPLSDTLQAHKLSQSKQAARYELLAALPCSSAAYQLACTSLEVDMISFDPAALTAGARLPRKLVRQAVERGVAFEVQYAPCLLDPSTRRASIALAHSLHATGRGRATLLLCSGAQHPDHLRDPYDISNLGMLFGLSEERAQTALTSTCRTLLLKAEARRQLKGVVSVRCVSEALPSEVPSEQLDSSKPEDQSNATIPAKKPRNLCV